VNTVPGVAAHFVGKEPGVAATYAAILRVARALGPCNEEAKKTSIHLVRRTAFAGVATQRTALVLTLKSSRDRKSPRIRKHEQASANRWHLEIRLDSPEAVDAELRDWLTEAYRLAE